MTSKLLFALLLLPLSGCQAIYSLTGRNDRTVKYERPIVDNLDETRKYTYTEADGKKTDTKHIVSLKDEFLKAQSVASAAGTNATLNKEYFKRAAAYSDGICDAWFTLLFSEVRQHNYNLSFFNILMGTATAVMGIAEANSTIVGGAGIGQSLVNAESKNYSAAFLFTPQVEVLNGKLRTARKDLKAALEAVPGNFVHFSDAQRAVQEYDHTRSPAYIQDLLRKSTDLVKFVVADTEDHEKQARIDAALVRLANALEVNGGISREDAKGIYVYLNLPTSKPAKDFEKRYPNLVGKVNSKRSLGAFEDALRDLTALLDLVAHASAVANSETSDTKALPGEAVDLKQRREEAENWLLLHPLPKRPIPSTTTPTIEVVPVR